MKLFAQSFQVCPGNYICRITKEKGAGGANDLFVKPSTQMLNAQSCLFSSLRNFAGRSTSVKGKGATK